MPNADKPSNNAPAAFERPAPAGTCPNCRATLPHGMPHASPHYPPGTLYATKTLEAGLAYAHRLALELIRCVQNDLAAHWTARDVVDADFLRLIAWPAATWGIDDDDHLAAAIRDAIPLELRALLADAIATRTHRVLFPVPPKPMKPGLQPSTEAPER